MQQLIVTKKAKQLFIHPILLQPVGDWMNKKLLELFYLMLISFGGLAGFTIETMRQLQANATDP